MNREFKYKFVIETEYIEGGSFHTDYEDIETAKATYDDLMVRDDYESFIIIKCSQYGEEDEISEEFFEADVYNAMIKEAA